MVVSISHSDRPRHGFTLVEIMIVVAIIGVLCAIAIPNLVRARATAQANACINNLSKLSEACDQFALEYGKHIGDPVSLNSDLTPYIKLNASSKIPPCPASGKYSLDQVGDTPTCSLGNLVSPPHVLDQLGANGAPSGTAGN